MAHDQKKTRETLKEAEVVNILPINESVFVVEFSTGDVVSVEIDKLKDFALQEGTLLSTEEETD